MKLPDLLALRFKEPKTFIEYGASQLIGRRTRQEDYFVNFNDECFIVADGVGGSARGDVAARLACDTALWAYKLVRQRPFYWNEKKEFMGRIFRSTNLTVWKKQQDRGFAGLATTLDVVIVNNRNYWFGHVGDASIYLYRSGKLNKLTVDHANKYGELTKYVGIRRLGLGPQIESGRLQPEDIILMITDGITNALAPQSISTLLEKIAALNQAPVDFIATLLKHAQEANDGDNMTACVIRRISE